MKRLMGRKLSSPEAQLQKRLAPYSIVEATNGDAWVRAAERDMSPPEVSALILQRMKEVAEAYLGEEVTEAVVTVRPTSTTPSARHEGRRQDRRARREAHH